MDKEAFKKLHVTVILFQCVRLAYIETSIYIIFFPMLEGEPRALHIARQTLYHEALSPAQNILFSVYDQICSGPFSGHARLGRGEDVYKSDSDESCLGPVRLNWAGWAKPCVDLTLHINGPQCLAGWSKCDFWDTRPHLVCAGLQGKRCWLYWRCFSASARLWASSLAETDRLLDRRM